MTGEATADSSLGSYSSLARVYRNGVQAHPYAYGSTDPANRVDRSGLQDIFEDAELNAKNETPFAAARRIGQVAEGDICYAIYLADTASCGEFVTDDAAYEACMARAWFNLFRCDQGLPRI